MIVFHSTMVPCLNHSMRWIKAKRINLIHFRDEKNNYSKQFVWRSNIELNKKSKYSIKHRLFVDSVRLVESRIKSAQICYWRLLMRFVEAEHCSSCIRNLILWLWMCVPKHTESFVVYINLFFFSFVLLFSWSQFANLI